MRERKRERERDSMVIRIEMLMRHLTIQWAFDSIQSRAQYLVVFDSDACVFE